MQDKWVAECLPCGVATYHDTEDDAINDAETHVEEVHRKTPAGERADKRMGHVQLRSVEDEQLTPPDEPHPAHPIVLPPDEPPTAVPPAPPPTAQPPAPPQPPTKPALAPPPRTTKIEVAKPSVTVTTRRR